MAQLVKTFLASKPATLVADVNTYLATLTNPTIRRFDISVIENARHIGTELTAALTYTTAGAVLATPFLLRLDEGSKLPTVEATLQAFLTANPTYFVGGTALRVTDNPVTHQVRKYYLATIYNVTAGATANYLLY